MLRGGAIPPPPLAQGKAPSSSHGGKKRSGSNVRRPRRGINPKKRGEKRGKKRGRNTSSSPPYGDLIRRTLSSNTLGTYESPQFFAENVGPETFSNDVTDKEYKCSLCQVEYSACSYDPQNPSLPFLICEHRFCRDCIEDMKGGQDCPIHHCRGKNRGKFQLDEELVRKIIEKSCCEEDSQSALNNGFITNDVAGSSRRNQSQSLTSG